MTAAHDDAPADAGLATVTPLHTAGRAPLATVTHLHARHVRLADVTPLHRCPPATVVPLRRTS